MNNPDLGKQLNFIFWQFAPSPRTIFLLGVHSTFNNFKRWFVSLKLGAHTHGTLGRLVSSLVNLKATSPAIALLQLVPNGYSVAARIYSLVY